MKSSIIEARDMLSTLSARGMEKWPSNLLRANRLGGTS